MNTKYNSMMIGSSHLLTLLWSMMQWLSICLQLLSCFFFLSINAKNHSSMFWYFVCTIACNNAHLMLSCIYSHFSIHSTLLVLSVYFFLFKQDWENRFLFSFTLHSLMHVEIEVLGLQFQPFFGRQLCVCTTISSNSQTLFFSPLSIKLE